jgi:hypothetical protein
MAIHAQQSARERDPLARNFRSRLMSLFVASAVWQQTSAATAAVVDLLLLLLTSSNSVSSSSFRLGSVRSLTATGYCERARKKMMGREREREGERELVRLTTRGQLINAAFVALSRMRLLLRQRRRRQMRSCSGAWAPPYVTVAFC